MTRRRARLAQEGLPRVPDTDIGGEEHGRFPGFDTLDQADTWDDVTKGVVLSRLGPPPPMRYFTVDEERVARPLVDRLLAQEAEPKIPLLEMIDARLSEEQTDGWRYDNLPPDGEAWRRSLAALDGDATSATGKHFWELAIGRQNDLLEAVRTHSGEWHGLPASRVWDLWLRYACTAFYAHPMAWNEIGFGGPAYPRGYKNFGIDRREPWEVPEADALDPVPWSARVEAARRRHQMGAPEEAAFNRQANTSGEALPPSHHDNALTEAVGRSRQ